MSVPPTPPPYYGPPAHPHGAPYPPPGGADPGRIPLRPLAVGDLLGGGFALARRHLQILAPLAVGLAVLSVAGQFTVLATTGTLDLFASGEWLTTWQRGVTEGRVDVLPTGVYLGVAVGSVISIAGALVLAGAAAICAAEDAVTLRPDRAQVSAAVRRALPRLAAFALLAAVAILAGSLLFLVPGVLIYLQWGVAGPIIALERASAGRPLARSTRLTRGHRMRFLGVTVLVVVITALIDAVIASFAVPVAGAVGVHLSAVGELLLADAVGALVAGITASWVGAVIALAYIDMRLRSENLAPALRAAAR